MSALKRRSRYAASAFDRNRSLCYAGIEAPYLDLEPITHSSSIR
jgi:hypothetical protein